MGGAATRLASPMLQRVYDGQDIDRWTLQSIRDCVAQYELALLEGPTALWCACDAEGREV